MTIKDLNIEDWNPDFNESGNSVWEAEWNGPEEPLTEDELKEEFMMMTYKGTDVYRWYYPQVLECVKSNSVEEFLNSQPISEVTPEDKQELLDFFKHWIWFVSMDSQYKPEMTFEADEVLEEIGDDILSEIDNEYEQLGKQSELTKSVKRTLH